MENRPSQTEGGAEAWDHSTHANFYDYYAEQSASEATMQRFGLLRDALLAAVAPAEGRRLEVADIGGGAGAAAMLWAEAGHDVYCLDINEPLIELGRQRAGDAGLSVRFEVGSATDVPLPDASVDVCLVPELLEHVVEWERCLDEFARITRPGGLLYLSTTNKLCPRQCEYNLPLYSWYPAPLKRRYEELARTTRPEIANFAKYPAVHWFSFYSLRGELRDRGFDRFLDRFDLAKARGMEGVKGAALETIRVVPGLRRVGQVLTPFTTIAAFRAA